MSSIKHHLNDALLMGYSAGTLPEAFNVVIATHVSLCDECRARLEAFDALGGTLLDDVDEAPMDERSFASCMTRIANADRVPVPAAPVTDLPAPLAAYVGGCLDAVSWRRIGGGVSQAILKTSKSATVRMLRIPGGVEMPDHGHRGTELTLVLRGAFRDEQDRFGPGDIEIANEDHVHHPVAEPGEDCICLAASDAPLRFNTLLPRIAQPFFRI
ncbi:ChrR family anti-sigma-E factor [Aestuariibius sp. 2305UL40-4]|uniref:ChrR family anti-sigma-E factor n=1 Tax=Aestuariibius violaceus TaxID=3234132 RepID=UPI00345E3426